MDDLLRFMLENLFSVSADATDELSTGVASYRAPAYSTVTSIHDSVILPLSSSILAVMFVLELARNSTHIESDHQTGVKIIAGTMFKFSLLMIATQHALLILEAIDEVATVAFTGVAQYGDGSWGDAGSRGLPSGLTDKISGSGDIDKAGMLMLIIIPFLVAMIAQLVLRVMVVLRFAELYFLTAFAALPVAFLGNPDTKSMGVGYLQRYAAVSLQSATLILATRLYGPFAGLTEIASPGGDESLSG